MVWQIKDAVKGYRVFMNGGIGRVRVEEGVTKKSTERCPGGLLLVHGCSFLVHRFSWTVFIDCGSEKMLTKYIIIIYYSPSLRMGNDTQMGNG